MDRLITFNCLGVALLLIFGAVLLWRMRADEKYYRAKIYSCIGLFLISIDYLLFRSSLGTNILYGKADFNPINLLMIALYTFLPFTGALLIVIGVRQQ
jgi:hypothetical protein